MGIDISKIKQRMNKLQNKGNGDSRFWRPEDGETVIRLVPTADGDPFKDYWFHYNLGKNPGFLSPKKNFGEDDPLDGFIRQLFNEGTDDSIKMAKNLMARQRFFSPVIVRGEEDKGVRVWGYGKMAYEKLLSLVLNPEYGDITDPDQGTDLVIHYGKPAGASFPQTKITPRRKSSPLSEDSATVAEYLDTVPDFTDLFDRKSPDQVGALLEEYLSGDESAEERSEETSKYGQADNDTVSDVDAAFNDLLGS
jgi:hypothetical protein|tara:strand:- start:400 stop:1152 length:753 start_codon:yes stop_codon:yes gene_type:complete